MFSEKVANACKYIPHNYKDRFLLYPALAVYSPVDNLIRTSVGGIFTVLSLICLGLCPPLNRAANWTRYSRGIVTIPLQIIGNIFKRHSEILNKYNVAIPQECTIKNAAMNAYFNDPKKSIDELLDVSLAAYQNNFDYLADVKGTKAQNICSRLFHTSEESKIIRVAKHIIFRVYSLINMIACTTLLTFYVPILSIIFIPVAVFNRGNEKLYNDFAFMIAKMPELIHVVCLSLRMIVNPLQFVKETPNPNEVTNPWIQALNAPQDFWKNTLELQKS